ncbi:MAG: glycosyltransferase family 4 protein [Gemmatimonadales bacterium]
MSEDLHVVVPGPLDQLTGGYIYDARMVSGLRELGWTVAVHDLPGRFPDADARALAALEGTLASLPDAARVVVDGLAMGGAPEPVERHAGRLRILSLVHHPLADETGWSDADRLRLRDSERRALAPCRGVLVSSPFTAQALAAYGVEAARVRVVLPGTEPARAAPGPPEGRPPVLLCVASLTPRKGHDVLVEALAAVADLPWTCILAGSPDRDPAHAARVRRLVADAGLTDRVRFEGEREGAALEALYQGASVFVLASHHEGYGMALADALARGLPVVSTTGGAIPHTVPREAGILVAPGDPAAFAAALSTLLGPTGAAERARRGAAARRYAATLPTWRDSARAFAAAVEELTA